MPTTPTTTRLPKTAATVLLPACGAFGAAPALALGPAQLIASGLSDALFLTAPAGDSRLFVVQRTGVISVLSGGTATPYLNLSSRVETSGERGLLGLAFAPDYASSGHFY